MAPLNQMVMQPSPLGELFVSMADITGPASYTTGGIVVSPQAFALQSFKFAVGAVSQSATYSIEARSVAGPGASSIKLVWFVIATGVEVANAFNLSAEIVRVLAFGN